MSQHRSRLTAHFTLVAASLLWAASASALPTGATEGTLNESTPKLEFTGTVPADANPLSLSGLGYPCQTGTVECDEYPIVINTGAAWLSTHPQGKVRITLVVEGDACMEEYFYDRDAGAVKSSAVESCVTPQVMEFAANGGNGNFWLDIVPVLAEEAGYSATVELLPGTPGSDGDGDGVPDSIDQCAGTPPGARVDATGCPITFGNADPVVPGAPRYQVWYPTPGAGAEGGNGEYSIGFNPKTGNIMAMSLGFGPGSVGVDVFSAAIFRVTPPERLPAAMPESCDATWFNKSDQFKDVAQPVSDPILWTDQDTGRTFAADNTTGANPQADWAFSDDDGENWTPVGVGVAGADHETVVSGPYPAGSPFEQIARARGYGIKDASGAVVKGKAVWFCAQDVAPGTCIRSDDGGLTWTPPQVAYNGTDCNNLHGHLHIAPDGTAYLPVKHCGSGQGGAYTTDAGLTWNEFTVPGTTKQGNGSDPSVAIDDAGKLYYCYVDGDGHARVKTGSKLPNGSLSWPAGLGFDLGATHGITNASFTEAVGGDSGRAACGFLGTNDPSPNYQSMDFKGVWYLYVASTFDGGATWTTVNATPNDPVQGVGGIWQAGGSQTNRNLLDFNEVTLDDHGRVLFGYNDGCVGACDAHPDTSPTYVAHLRVARQTGGRTLRAAWDAQTDRDAATIRAPKASCLAGARSGSVTHLTWKAPDHGGSAIAQYQVFSLASNNKLMHLGDTDGDVARFDDARPTAGIARYVVRAVNAAGLTGETSNVALGPGEPYVNHAPRAALSATPSQVETGGSVSFDVAPSDADGDTLAWDLDFGDGSAHATGSSGATVSHTYTAAATRVYTATLKVTETDTDPALSNSAGVDITVLADDTDPDAFAFATRTNVPTSAFPVSAPVTVTGINAAAPISAGDGGQYSVNGGAFTNQPGVVHVGDTVVTRHRTADTANTATDSSVTIGTLSATYRTVTGARDRSPDAMEFFTVVHALPGTLVESNVITPTGFDSRAPLSARGLEYRVNGGAWASDGGFLLPGQTLQVRMLSSTTARGMVRGTVHAGGTIGAFVVRTR